MQDRKRGAARIERKGDVGATVEYPQHLRKSSCIYLSGTITHSCRGVHKVELENNLIAICSSSRLDHRKVSLLVGDSVMVEIPTDSLSPNDSVRGRIVWRKKR